MISNIPVTKPSVINLNKDALLHISLISTIKAKMLILSVILVKMVSF